MRFTFLKEVILLLHFPYDSCIIKKKYGLAFTRRDV